MAAIQRPAATIQASGYGTTNAFGTVVDGMTGSLDGRQPVNTADWSCGAPPPP